MSERIPDHAHWVRVPRFFGDAMMCFAAIARLRSAGLPIVMWGPAWVVDLFDGCPDIRAVMAEPQRDYSPFQAATMLRRHRVASVINFPKSHRPMLAAWLARVPLRLGCGDHGAWLLYTHSVAFHKQDKPFVERYSGVVRQAFPSLSEPRAFLPFRPRAEVIDQAERVRKERNIGDYVVFAPGANTPNKRLSLRSFQEIGKILEQQGFRIVILGGKGEDQTLATELLDQLPRAVDLTGQLSLAQSAAWILGAKAMVGGDTGLAHLAAGSAVPTLCVFGPTRPKHSAPWGPKVKIIRKETLPCLECMAFSCHVEGHPCMDFTAGEVLWNELHDMLSNPASFAGVGG